MIDYEVVNQTINELKTEYENYYLEQGIELDSERFYKLGNIQKFSGLIEARKRIIPLLQYEYIPFTTIESVVTKEQILAITTLFIDVCNNYNVVGFVSNYCMCLRCSEEYYYSVINNNVSFVDVEFNTVCSDCFKSVRSLAKVGILNKLSEDRTGVVVLANNEKSVGLEYAQKRTLEKVAIDNLNPAQLPTFSGLKLLE